MSRAEPVQSFQAGTLAGAGSFHCEECGFAIALHECDEVPACPHCGGTEFKRSSIFGGLALREPVGPQQHITPDWLREAREALPHAGWYLAYEQDGRLQVIALHSGWTRIGRSLSADVRFDDPTVSRRHALVNVEGDVVRILDDRSLNGVFVDGERIDMRELRDGDELSIGRFRLYLMARWKDPQPRSRFSLRGNAQIAKTS